MPCPRCGQLLVIGSLRCKHCGADTHKVRPISPMLGVADVIGHDVEAFLEKSLGLKRTRRAKILDEMDAICPGFTEWARQPAATRGAPPPIAPERQAELDALCEEYDSLR